MANKVWILSFCFLCLVGCYTGHIPTSVLTLKANNTIDLPVNTFKITQSKNLYSKYPNHFSQYLLNRFKSILEGKLVAKGLSSSDDPDIELKIVEFNLLNRELDSVKIEIYSQAKHLETMTYRPLDLGGGVSYFKKTPSMNMASEKIAKKIMYIFNLAGNKYFEIAKNKIKELSMDVNNMQCQDNSDEWKGSLQKRGKKGEFANLLKKLADTDFVAIYCCPKELNVLGGDINIFIDRETHEIIDVLRGQ